MIGRYKTNIHITGGGVFVGGIVLGLVIGLLIAAVIFLVFYKQKKITWLGTKEKYGKLLILFINNIMITD